jgi:hypothetical protein
MLHPENIQYHPPMRTIEQARKGLAWARSNLFQEHEAMMLEMAAKAIAEHHKADAARWAA